MTSTDPKPSPPRRPGLLRRTLARRRMSIFTRWALLTVALMSATYVLLVGPYRASSLLRVAPPNPDLFGVKAGGDSFDPFLQTQVQLITSPNVLTAAGANPKVAALPRIAAAGDVVQELRKSMVVGFIPGTYLIEVSTTSPSAAESATLVNAVVNSYLEANVEWSDGMTKTEIRKLEAYKSELNNKIDELERRWKDLVARGDTGQKAKQSNLISPDHGAKIEEKLVENDLARLEAQAQLDALRARQVKDEARVEELETRVEAANLLERALNARRASGGFDPRNLRTDEVEIKLIIEERESLKEIQEAVARRLEQLRFEARGEARVRLVNPAVPPGRRTDLWYRPWVLAIIPFATFAGVLSFFAGVEAWSTSKARPGTVEPPAEV